MISLQKKHQQELSASLKRHLKIVNEIKRQNFKQIEREEERLDIELQAIYRSYELKKLPLQNRTFK